MGDVFTTRVPAEIKARIAQALADGENYIADYNIYMGNLRTEDGRQLWDNDKVLLSHWNLRDELKALYQADNMETRGLNREKQEMIYRVMQRIVDQSIPAEAVNNSDFVWKPYNDPREHAHEPYTRYERILEIAQALSVDEHGYYPQFRRRCRDLCSGIGQSFPCVVRLGASEKSGFCYPRAIRQGLASV